MSPAAPTSFHTPHTYLQVATPAAPSADQDWWVAELDVPFEAVAVNFVISYYEYYDNNGLQDYKLLVGAHFDFEFEFKTSLMSFERESIELVQLVRAAVLFETKV